MNQDGIVAKVSDWDLGDPDLNPNAVMEADLFRQGCCSYNICTEVLLTSSDTHMICLSLASLQESIPHIALFP